MADLTLCFAENSEDRPLTSHEINELIIAAHGAHAIIKVMREYGNNYPQGKGNDTLGIYGSVFTILDLVMEPIRDYLCEYAGHEAAPEKVEA